MRNLIIGIVIGLLVGTTLAKAQDYTHSYYEGWYATLGAEQQTFYDAGVIDTAIEAVSNAQQNPQQTLHRYASQT